LLDAIAGRAVLMTLAKFKLLESAQAPPRDSAYVLLVHRIGSDRRSVVHDFIVKPPGRQHHVGWMCGDRAFTGTAGEAVQRADMMAAQLGAPIVYLRDDTEPG
jgi:hypothetical protein